MKDKSLTIRDVLAKGGFVHKGELPISTHVLAPKDMPRKSKDAEAKEDAPKTEEKKERKSRARKRAKQDEPAQDETTEQDETPESEQDE